MNLNDLLQTIKKPMYAAVFSVGMAASTLGACGDETTNNYNGNDNGGDGEYTCESACRHVVDDCNQGYGQQECIDNSIEQGYDPEANCPSEFNHCVKECYDGHYNFEFRHCLATAECDSNSIRDCGELYTGE